MTEQEKKLLVADLCCRLPYNPKVKFAHFHVNGDDQDVVLNIHNAYKLLTGVTVHKIRPYLRSLDGRDIQCGRWDKLDKVTSNLSYLLENHYDINGLIAKGLAIEAPESMYPRKTI